ncbi:MAG: DsbA family protein [Alphaproteobacteria bacterium]
MIKKLKKALHKEKAAPAEKKDACSCGCGCDGDCKCGCGCCCGKKKAVVLVGALVVAGLVGYAGARFGGCCEKKLNEYVQSHPKEIIASVENYYKKLEADRRGGEEAAPAQATAPAELVAEIVNDKTNYSLGNPKGKFVIIEFFDHNCGWCKRTNKEMREAVKRAKNIRWIPIDTPIFGDASETIARYVLAAGEQGKYAQMHEAVGNAQGRLDEDALVKLGEGLKLDTKKLKADANGDKIRGKLEANKVYAQKLNINGVPMLIVDGKINPGALLGENLEKAVQASQAKK